MMIHLELLRLKQGCKEEEHFNVHCGGSRGPTTSVRSSGDSGFGIPAVPTREV